MNPATDTFVLTPEATVNLLQEMEEHLEEINYGSADKDAFVNTWKLLQEVRQNIKQMGGKTHQERLKEGAVAILAR